MKKNKMGEVKLNKKKQSTLKGISKATYIIAKIGKICATICIPIMILTLFVITFLMTKLDVVDNQIVLSVSDEKISLSEEVIDGQNTLKVKVDNVVVAEEKGEESIEKLRDFLASKPKWQLITLVDLSIVLIIVTLFLFRETVKHLEKLSKNIGNEETPFSMENVNHFKMMAYLLIARLVVSGVASGVADVLSKGNLVAGFSTINIFEILFLFTMSYIFEYGYEIQSESKATIYGETNETDEK